jgi:hypothetical protein
MTSTAAADRVDALVIFGATGDLAKLETFPALVGLVDRGVLDVPVIGVAKSGWGLDQFRDYAAASLKLNGMDPDSPAARTMLGLLRYVDGDLDDPATYTAMSNEIGNGTRALFYLEVPPVLFGRIAQGISGAGRADGARVMVEKPFGTDLASAQQLNQTMLRFFPEDAVYRVDHWLGLDCRGPARAGLVALGRRPHPHPGRQDDAGHRHRGQHPLPPAAARPLPRQRPHDDQRPAVPHLARNPDDTRPRREEARRRPDPATAGTVLRRGTRL